MLNLRKTVMIACGSLLLSGAVISTASADCSSGFLANLGCQTGIISQQTANNLDAAHAQMGRPLDHLANQAAGAAANYVVPGSGGYVTQGLEFRDQYNRGAFGGGMPNGAPNNGGMGMPMQQQVGSFCATAAGRFPGPFNPVGSFCQAVTPWGMMQGQVTL